jgi:hypothetical protein
MRSRDEQVIKATKAAYWGSRRPRRAKILQVPTYDAPARGTGTMRPVIVPYPIRAISWEEAREIGKAYGRVLDGFPKYDREFEQRQREYHNRRAAAKQQAATAPKVERFRKPAQGMWWMNKLADVVERRTVITKPAYGARRRTPKDPQPVVSE